MKRLKENDILDTLEVKGFDGLVAVWFNVEISANIKFPVNLFGSILAFL